MSPFLQEVHHVVLKDIIEGLTESINNINFKQNFVYLVDVCQTHPGNGNYNNYIALLSSIWRLVNVYMMKLFDCSVDFPLYNPKTPKF